MDSKLELTRTRWRRIVSGVLCFLFLTLLLTVPPLVLPQSKGELPLPTPVPTRPGIVAGSVIWRNGHRLLDSWTWGTYREFKMSGDRPVNPYPCSQACDRSLICMSWTMVLKGRAPYSLSGDTCFLQAIAPEAHGDRCCYTGLRTIPRATISETVTGDGESYVANSSYADYSFGTALLRGDANAWSCRAACIEQAATVGPGVPKCEYWTFIPRLRTAPPPADRMPRCLYSAAGAALHRADAGWVAGGPVPVR